MLQEAFRLFISKSGRRRKAWKGGRDIYSFEDLTLLLKLTKYAQDGVKLYLNKEPATPDEIVDAVSVRENKDTYMPDYVDDEYGELSQIRYDKVCEE